MDKDVEKLMIHDGVLPPSDRKRLRSVNELPSNNGRERVMMLEPLQEEIPINKSKNKVNDGRNGALGIANTLVNGLSAQVAVMFAEWIASYDEADFRHKHFLNYKREVDRVIS